MEKEKKKEEKKKSKLKLVIIIIILLLVVDFVGMKIVNKLATSKIHQVGDTIETDAFSYTLESAEFVDGISCDVLNFFVPSTEGVNIIRPEEGYKLLYFTGKYSDFKGKNSFEASSYTDKLFKPTIKYNEYNFDNNYVVIQNIDNKWYSLSSDLDYSQKQHYKVDVPDCNVEHTPLEGKTYPVRRMIGVPETALSNDNIILKLSFINHINSKVWSNFDVKYSDYSFKINLKS